MAADKPEFKVSTLLEKGMVVLGKVMAIKEVTLTKPEMIDFINFETAVKFIIDAEQKAEAAKTPPPSAAVETTNALS